MPAKKIEDTTVVVLTSIALCLHILCRVIIPRLFVINNFKQKKKETVEHFSTVFDIAKPISNSLLPPPAINDSTYLINLKRRPDRLVAFQKDYDISDIPTKFKIIEGVDGSKLDLEKQDLTELAIAELRQLETTGFRSKHYQLTRGAIGCYLSHISVWKNIVKDGSKVGLVFEDDAKIPVNFQAMSSEALKNPPPDWDIILLGVACHTCNGVRTRPGFLRVKKFWLLHAYLIKAESVRKIFKSDALFPIAQQIDSLLSEMANTLNIYAVTPGIVNQRASRTDIQAPIRQDVGVDTLARMPIGVTSEKSQSINTTITNSLLPTTYKKNGGSAELHFPANLNNSEDQEEEINTDISRISNYT